MFQTVARIKNFILNGKSLPKAIDHPILRFKIRTKMKKNLAFAVLLLSALVVSGQNDIQFGFQLSPTFSWMNTDNNRVNSNGSNLGLKLGMIGEYFFRDNYSLSTGIGFHFNAGGALFYEESVDSLSIWSEAGLPGDNQYEGGTSFRYNLQYVEIPIGLKLRTREFGYVRYFVEPHVAFGFRTQARGSVENDGAVDPDERFNIETGVNLLNLYWGIGGGLEYSISESTALVGGIAFQSGFADVTKDKGTSITANNRVDAEEDSKGKISSIVIRLGIMF